MDPALRNRAACLAPLLIALPLALGGLVDPLALPVLGGLSLGFALRPVGGVDLALCLAGALVLGGSALPAQLIGAAALLVIGAAGCARPVGAAALLGGVALGAAVALDPDGPASVLLQLRLLALAGGGGLLAVLALGFTPAPHANLVARRAAAVAAAVGLFCLCRHAAVAWPDGWRLTSPYLLWAGPALAALAIGARGRLAVAAGPAGAALLGALSGTALGVHGAAWALAGLGLAAGLADVQGRLDRWTAALVAGLPVGLPAAAAGVALWAAATAVHPAPLRFAALLTGGLILIGAASTLWTSTETTRTGRRLAVGLMLLGPLFIAAHPPTAGAEHAARQIDGHRLPIDDMRGWRRLSRLDAPPPPAPPDAGVP